MIVRRELPADHSAVRGVHTAAFGGRVGTPTAEARLVEELRQDGDAIPALSLVATLDDEVVGHVLCSRGHVGDRPAIGLAPLGVRPEHQRRGVGSALMHAVLAAADALDEPAVALLGDPEYYSRFGFVPAGSVGVQAPDESWGRHFQVRTLTTWDATTRGAFRYAPAFGRL